MAEHIRVDQFVGDDGHVDWSAYKKAEVENGERCKTCSHFVLFPSGHPSQCAGCERAKIGDEPLTHDRLARCPDCGALADPRESERFDGDSPFSMYCPACDTNYDIEITINYTFTSPPRTGSTREATGGHAAGSP